jgi:ubiquinone/menaquinone biosynthesis C-methylase UbiE
MENNRTHVCPVERAHSLDSRIRKWLQDPHKILSPYVREGMTVLDLGCGPGFFSIEMAKMVGPSGRVIAADLQDGMLQKIRDKVQGTDLEARITLRKCEEDSINVTEKIDFGLTFYMVHEVPDKENLFKALKTILNENGQILLVEPKLFHVSEGEFDLSTRIAEHAGFKIHPGPRLPFSWSAELSHKPGNT